MKMVPSIVEMLSWLATQVCEAGKIKVKSKALIEKIQSGSAEKK